MSKTKSDMLVIEYLTDLAVNYDLAPDIVYNLADDYAPWDYDKLVVELDMIAVNRYINL